MDPQRKRRESAISQVREARTGVSAAVRAAEVRASAVAAFTASARPDQSVRAGLVVELDDQADAGGARPVDVALVPRDSRLEPLGDALVLCVADDPLLADERALGPSLVRFGVRRYVVAVWTEARLLEWWPEMRDFAEYRADLIEDRALARPIEVSALFAGPASRELVTRALIDADAWPLPLVREQAVLVERRDALGRLLHARSLAPERRHLARIEACVDVRQLASWIELTSRARTIDDVFADSADPE